MLDFRNTLKHEDTPFGFETPGHDENHGNRGMLGDETRQGVYHHRTSQIITLQIYTLTRKPDIQGSDVPSSGCRF